MMYTLQQDIDRRIQEAEAAAKERKEAARMARKTENKGLGGKDYPTAALATSSVTREHVRQKPRRPDKAQRPVTLQRSEPYVRKRPEVRSCVPREPPAPTHKNYARTLLGCATIAVIGGVLAFLYNWSNP